MFFAVIVNAYIRVGIKNLKKKKKLNFLINTVEPLIK